MIACAKTYFKFSFFLLFIYSFSFALFLAFHYSQLIMSFLIHCSHPVKIGQHGCFHPYDFASIASNRFISSSLFSLPHFPSPFLNTYTSPTPTICHFFTPFYIFLSPFPNFQCTYLKIIYVLINVLCLVKS